MKNQKGFIVPTLLVIIGLLIIGGGIYVYKNKKSDKEKLKEQIGIECRKGGNGPKEISQKCADLLAEERQKYPEEFPTGVNNTTQIDHPLTQSDDTSNFKTYINTKYGFEFKYPETSSLDYKYKLVEVKQTQLQYIYSRDWSFVDSVGVSEDYQTDDPEYKPSFVVTMINITSSLGNNFKNYVENKVKSYFGSDNVSSQFIDISGDRWVEINLGTDLQKKIYFIFHNEKIYSMSLNYTENHPELEKIPSTFKFTK